MNKIKFNEFMTAMQFLKYSDFELYNLVKNINLTNDNLKAAIIISNLSH